jgi:hypothetical protein
MPKIQYEKKNFAGSTLEIIKKAEEIITEYQDQGYQLTLRQLYYQFVSLDLIPNTERSYKRIGSIISDARRAGMIDWDAIEDRTRFIRSNSSWDGPKDILESARYSYHRDLWATQDYRIEVWVEKDALIGVLERVCKKLDVPYFSCRGYVSDSEMWAGAMRMRDHTKNGQDVILLHLGDHDPSGIDMTRDIAERIQLFSQDRGHIVIERIALTREQIEDQAPPPNPAKVTDSRFEAYRYKYGEDSWELDALQPQYINKLITDHVNEYRDMERWDKAYQEQEDERAQIASIIKRWNKINS